MNLISRPILQHGTAAPYVALFNVAGEPIVNILTGYPIGAYINSFSYKTEQGKENLATIIITTGNPVTVDDPSLQEGQTILIQWGYIYADGSSHASIPLVIKIRDVDILFNDQGTQITLKCIDSSSRIRQIPIWVPTIDPDDESKNTTFKQFMDEGFGNKTGIIIEQYTYE